MEFAMHLKVLTAYLLLLNIIGFWSMRNDKRRAAAHGRRTPEKRLLAYALLGGSAGCILGMYVCRHKTKHRSFVFGLPIILLFQVLVIFLAVLRIY